MRLDLWTIKLTIVVLAIGGFGVVQRQEKAPNMTIYYVPLGVETLTPITSTNIQERGRRCEIQSAEDIDNIKRVLRRATKPPSQKFRTGGFAETARIIQFGNGLLAVMEKEGQVRFSDGTEGSISQKV